MDDEDDERGGKAAALGALAAHADARGSAYDADGGARAARAAAGGKEAGAWRCNARAGLRSASQRAAAAGADASRCFGALRRCGPLSPRVLQGVRQGG